MGLGLAPYLFEVCKIAYSHDSTFSDLLITHLPNATFIHRSIAQFGQVPLWSPAIFSGYPFSSDPLSGLFYFPNWITFLFPTPAAFNLLILLHLFGAAIGTFFFLRQEGRGPLAALLGALLVGNMPKLFAHWGAGHVSLVPAVCWTPWLLWAEKGLQLNTSKWKKVLPGIIWGCALLADLRWAPWLAGLWLAYVLFQKPSRQRILIFAGNFLAGIFLSAPVWVPLLAALPELTRSGLQAQDNLVYSLPASRLVGLIFPDSNNSAEWTFYPGVIALGLAFLGLGAGAFTSEKKFWWGIWIGSLLLAMGGAIPGLNLIFQLPGASLLRVPARGLFLTSLASAALASQMMDELLAKADLLTFRRPYNIWLALTGLAGLCVVMDGVVIAFKPSFEWSFVVNGLTWIGLIVILSLYRRKSVSNFLLAGILLGLCLLDLGVNNFLSIDFRDEQAVELPGKAVAGVLNRVQPQEPFRTYSPSYSLPQYTAMLHNIQLADGVDPLQLKRYVAYMGLATGVPAEGYSVTLPAFKTGNPAEDNLTARPDLKKLGLLNVRYLLSDFELPDVGAELLDRSGSTWIYQNPSVYPRAWVWKKDEFKLEDREAIGQVQILNHTPNQIILRATGPGILVLSEVYSSDWKVQVNGKPAEPLLVQDLLRGVWIDAGESQITWEYVPWPLGLGIIVSLLTMIGLFVVLRSRHG